MQASIHHFRGSCRLCGGKNLDLVLPFTSIPIGEHYSSVQIPENDNRFPIDIYQCCDCNAVQTQDEISTDYLWREYTYFSGQTRGIIKHFGQFSEWIDESYQWPTNKKAFDIGSNDGTLLKFLSQHNFDIFGIDPSSTVVEAALEDNIPTFLGLFNDKIVDQFPESTQKADLITAFNVFAHSEDMIGMIRGVKKMLNPDGLFCFEVQYLGDIAEKKLLGTFFHEHMVHYSAISAKNFLEVHGLKIIDYKRNNIQMGSIIFVCCHVESSRNISSKVDHLLKQEQDLGLNSNRWAQQFLSYMEEQRFNLQSLKASEGISRATLAAYGAARSGPTFAIQYGLENCISHIYDDHPMKCNKFGAFEGLYVKSTEELLADKPKIIVILAWLHSKAIINNHLEYLKIGGKFLILWPRVQLVTYDNFEHVLQTL